VGRERTERDALTGLASRRAFEEQLRQEAGRSAEQPFSLLLIDIDQFRGVNDAHGHAAGDAVIRAVARGIREVVGAAGTVARYGGEEFAVLLPGMEKEQGFLLAERIRASLEAMASGAGGESWPAVTVSGGVAAFPADGRTPGDIVRRADQALYRSKSTGRNRVCIAQEERMSTRTTHYTRTQLERLAQLAEKEGLGEAVLLREALDDLLIKYRVSEIET
jgi:diguanylate cyclase (GGDEF)-like protein